MQFKEKLFLHWRRYGSTERAFVLLPFLLLTPRLSPDLEVGHNGEPSLELVITLALFGLLILLGVEARQQVALRFHWQGRHRWLFWAIALFAGWSALSWWWTADVGATQDHTVLWLNYGALILVGRLVLRRRSVMGLLATLTTAGLGIAFFRLAQYWIAQGSRPLTSPIYKNFGVETELLVTILPLVLVIHLTTRRRALAGITLMVAAVIFMGGLSTYQRTPVLACAAALGLLTLGWLTKWLIPRNTWRVIALSLTLLLAGGLQFSLPAKVQDQLSRETGKDFVVKQIEGIQRLEVDTSSRLQFWGTALEMVRAHPLLGIGAGAYKAGYLDYRRRANVNPLWGGVQDFSQTDGAACIYRTHNEFMEVLGELGLIGLVLMAHIIFILAWLIWRTPRAQRWLALGISACALAFFISSSLTSYSLRWIPCGMLFFLLVALLLPMHKPVLAELQTTPVCHYGQWLVAVYTLLLLFGGARVGRVIVSEHYQFQAAAQVTVEPEQRIALYQKALAIDPYNFSAAAELGTVFYHTNQPQAAVHYLAYGVQHGINDIFNQAKLSFAYAQLGQHAHARETLQQAVEAYPGTIFPRVLYAEALAKEGDLPAAYEQRVITHSINTKDALMWELILQQGLKAATLAAVQQQLPHPAKLEPKVGLGVIQERERLAQ